MQNYPVRLIGLYSVEENPDVTLVELSIDRKANEIDIIEFTQETENKPKDSWQVPFDEKYLDVSGEKIIGDDFNLPGPLTETTRLCFFIYFLDISKPLLTPFGPIPLMQITKKPQRLIEIIQYEDPE